MTTAYLAGPIAIALLLIAGYVIMDHSAEPIPVVNTTTDHASVAIQPTHKVEMNILTPDTGHTCSEYFNWMIGVNNYDNTNNAAFDPNLPAIFPVSPVSGAKIVTTYMSNGTVISNGTQIADNNGVAILQLNQLATYNISITGCGVQEHSFVLSPADILYALCLERGSAPKSYGEGC